VGEIEAALLSQPAIREGVVVVRDDAPAGPYLVTYIVPADTSGIVSEQLLAHLEQRLPTSMVPTTFVSLEALPLSPNGKLDHRALPAPAAPRVDPGTAFVTPAVRQNLRPDAATAPAPSNRHYPGGAPPDRSV
jgi:acyl-coenzyme A synthetase/AMP-(fatty) acid ligase